MINREYLESLSDQDMALELTKQRMKMVNDERHKKLTETYKNAPNSKEFLLHFMALEVVLFEEWLRSERVSK